MPRLVPHVVPAGRMAGTTQPDLAGEGVALRPWTLDDVPALRAAYADPAIQRWHARTLADDAEAAHLVRRWAAEWLAETDAAWAVTHADSGAVLGRASLRHIELGEGVAEVAYWVLPAARGRGVARRGLAALTGWAFGTLGLHRLHLWHAVDNAASCRVAAAAGYPFEGIARSSVLHEDGWHDMHVHARIAGE